MASARTAPRPARRTRAHQPVGQVRPHVPADMPAWVKRGPVKGQRILACAHDSARYHWFTELDELGQPNEYRGKDGAPFRAHWIRLCPTCHRRGGNPVAKCRRDFILDATPTEWVEGGPC